MTESLLPDVANAVASGVVAALAERGSLAARKVLDLLRDKLNPPTTASGPSPVEDMDIVTLPASELLRLLEGRAHQEHAWAEAIRSAWEQLTPELVIEGGVANNSISGNVVGNVVQARDVDGGISLG